MSFRHEEAIQESEEKQDVFLTFNLFNDSKAEYCWN